MYASFYLSIIGFLKSKIMDYTARYILLKILSSPAMRINFLSQTSCLTIICWYGFYLAKPRSFSADATYFFKKGDIFLIPRNQLATIINYPKDGQPHKTVVMHLSVERLREFYVARNIKSKPLKSSRIYSFSNHPLLESRLRFADPLF